LNRCRRRTWTPRQIQNHGTSSGSKSERLAASDRGSRLRFGEWRGPFFNWWGVWAQFGFECGSCVDFRGGNGLGGLGFYG
jgi:hypothetical protein